MRFGHHFGFGDCEGATGLIEKAGCHPWPCRFLCCGEVRVSDCEFFAAAPESEACGHFEEARLDGKGGRECVPSVSEWKSVVESGGV